MLISIVTVTWLISRPLGTVHVLDQASTVTDHHVQKPGIKYDNSSSTPVVLVPQPSNDPNDPLVCTPL